MSQKLSDKAVRALTPPASGNRIIYDTEVKGFGVRVTAAGAKSFILNYRVNGRERRYTIGAYGPNEWSVGAARTEAGKRKRDIGVGIDPLAERVSARDAPTMADLFDDYIERHAVKKRTGDEDKRKIKKELRPKFGKRHVSEITSRDMEDLHHSMKGRPYQANRTMALLSKMFSLAIKWEWRTDNPCRGIEKYPEEKRERYLSPDEIGRLVDALSEAMNKTSANAVKLLLLTGARRGEVLKATWDQFDLDAGIWIKPSAHTKTKKNHRVPLSAPAMQLLVDMEKYKKGEYVFPGKVRGAAITDIKKFWKEICKTAELEGVRLHDLRHTFASVLASSGLSLLVIGRMLGHTQAATTDRYSHLYDDPLREAADRVGAVVEGAAGNRKSAEVVLIGKGEI